MCGHDKSLFFVYQFGQEVGPLLVDQLGEEKEDDFGCKEKEEQVPEHFYELTRFNQDFKK